MERQIQKRKQYKKKILWKDDYIKTLIELWSERKDEFKKCRKNSHIIAGIQEELENLEIFVDAEEIKNKIHNLLAKYRNEKKEVDRSGTPSEWPFFNSIEEILKEETIQRPNNFSSVNFEDTVAGSSDTSVEEKKEYNEFERKIIQPANNFSSVNFEDTMEESSDTSVEEKKKCNELERPIQRRKYKKKFFWKENSIRKLIEIWYEKKEELKKNRKNSHIIVEMQKKLESLGIIVDTEEIKNKIHNLLAKYRSEKKILGSRCDTSSEWPFFNSIEKIFINSPSVKFEDTMEESSKNTKVGSSGAKSSEWPFYNSIEEIFINSPSVKFEDTVEDKYGIVKELKKCNELLSTLIEHNKRSNVVMQQINIKSINIDKEMLDIKKQLLANEVEKNQILKEILKKMP